MRERAHTCELMTVVSVLHVPSPSPFPPPPSPPSLPLPSPSSSLPLLLQPYLHSVHNSPVKCQVVYSDVRPDIWQLVEKAGSLQNSVTHPARIKVSKHTHTCTHALTRSTTCCPCRSGPLMEAMWRPMPPGAAETSSSQDTRMEPSSSGTSLTVSIPPTPNTTFPLTAPPPNCPAPVHQRLLYTLRTSLYFQLEGERPESADRSLPNSRSVGFWDPRGDDERLMVTSICLEGWSLVVGFHGGQALVFKLNNQKTKHVVTVCVMRGACEAVIGRERKEYAAIAMTTLVPSRSCSPFA